MTSGSCTGERIFTLELFKGYQSLQRQYAAPQQHQGGVQVGTYPALHSRFQEPELADMLMTHTVSAALSLLPTWLPERRPEGYGKGMQYNHAQAACMLGSSDEHVHCL
jgi:hypothetical protein